MRDGAMWGIWAVSRLIVLLVLFTLQRHVVSDVFYYSNSLELLDRDGWGAILREYPTPAVMLIYGVWECATAIGNEQTFILAFIAAAVSADAALFAVLVHQGSRSAVAFWIAAVPLMGSLTYTRFDIWPGITAGIAFVVAAQRPRLAGALMGVAMFLKLWPVVAIPGLLLRARRWAPLLTSLSLVAASLVALSVMSGGWNRLASPLSFMASRGLHAESVAATPFVVAAAFGQSDWRIRLSQSSHSWEVSGPAISGVVHASSGLTLLLVGFLFVGWMNLTLLGRASDASMGWLVLAALSGLLVFSRVLSPQFFMWLAPMTAGVLCLGASRAIQAWAACCLLAIGLTQIAVPTLYASLVAPDGPGWIVACVLAARNLVLVGLFTTAVVGLWMSTGDGKSPMRRYGGSRTPGDRIRLG